MAQARQAPEAGGGGGAPRTNRTVKQFGGMNTQNRRNAVPEGQFPWLENIQPIGPGHLHSIPGRGLSVTRIPPTPPTGCPDTAPGPQVLPVVCCYDSNGFGDLGTNNAGMFAHANASGDFWHTASNASGFGSGPYPIATPSRTWYVLQPTEPGGPSCDLEEGSPLSLPLGKTANFQSTQTPQGGTCGMSDERSYILTLNSISPALFNASTDARTYFGESTGVSFLENSTNWTIHDVWCVSDSKFYAQLVGLGQPEDFCQWNLPAPNGTNESQRVDMDVLFPGVDTATFDPHDLKRIHASSSFLYVIIRGPFGGGADTTRLYKVQKDPLTYVTHWELSGDANFTNPWGLHVFSDSLIFLIQGGATVDWKIGKFLTASATTDVIGTLTPTCVNAGHPVGASGQSGFYYAKNYFYLSYSGYGFGWTNVLKIGPLVCPSDPTIPWED
jgi:hypothetical protein